MPRQCAPAVQAVVDRGGNRAAVRHAAAFQLQPDVQFLPQRPRELLACGQTLLRVHPLELAFDVVDPTNALDRLFGHFAGADEFVELASGMSGTVRSNALRIHPLVERAVVPCVLVAHQRALPRRLAFNLRRGA